jgi:hypothetical protein
VIDEPTLTPEDFRIIRDAVRKAGCARSRKEFYDAIDLAEARIHKRRHTDTDQDTFLDKIKRILHVR